MASHDVIHVPITKADMLMAGPHRYGYQAMVLSKLRAAGVPVRGMFIYGGVETGELVATLTSIMTSENVCEFYWRPAA